MLWHIGSKPFGHDFQLHQARFPSPPEKSLFHGDQSSWPSVGFTVFFILWQYASSELNPDEFYVDSERTFFLSWKNEGMREEALGKNRFIGHLQESQSSRPRTIPNFQTIAELYFKVPLTEVLSAVMVKKYIFRLPIGMAIKFHSLKIELSMLTLICLIFSRCRRWVGIPTVFWKILIR